MGTPININTADTGQIVMINHGNCLIAALVVFAFLIAPACVVEEDGENVQGSLAPPADRDAAESEDISNGEAPTDCTELDAEQCAAATHCRADDATTWDPVTRCLHPVFFRCLSIDSVCNSAPGIYLDPDGVCVTTSGICGPTGFIPDGYQWVELQDRETVCGYGSDVRKPDFDEEHTCE